MTSKHASQSSHDLTAIIEGGVEAFLKSSLGAETPGNEHVTITWDVYWENGTLTLVGNVKGKTREDLIPIVMTGFVSPEYPRGGRFYVGNMSSTVKASAEQMTFILQSRQFTEADYGKTIKAVVEGYVRGLNLFSFTKLFVIPKPDHATTTTKETAMESKENVVWTETRSRLGITVKLAIVHERGVLTLKGEGGGHGCGITYNRVINGNVEWSGVIGNCGGDVHLFLRITNWSLQNGYLRCNLTIWGAHGIGPWLPAGGEKFEPQGRLQGIQSREELAYFLATAEGSALIERSMAAPAA